MNFFARILKRKTAAESNISQALRAVVQADTPTSRQNLYDALTNQRLVVPVPKLPESLQRDSSGCVAQTTRLDFLAFKDGRGRNYRAVFTNPELLRRWKPQLTIWIAVDTPTLCRCARDSGLSALQINPGTENFVELTIDEIQMLAKRQAGT